MITKLSSRQKLLGENSMDLPDGNRIVTEVVKDGERGLVVGTFYFTKGASSPTVRSQCGYCDGVLVGCIDCPNHDGHVDCETHTMQCGFQRAESM